MYQPNYFEEKRTEVIHALMRAHPLAALVATTHDGLVANHIPLDIRPDPAPFGMLRGHIAKANPLWKVAGDSTQALAIFQGPQGYVSPSWYPSKQRDGKVVPTWNYAVAHAHGTLRFIHDAAWLRDLVETLTNQNESSRAHPWKVSDAPADYVEKMFSSVVGFELTITRLEGKWKMSQNRSEADRSGVEQGAREEGTPAQAEMAESMRLL